MGKRKKKGNYRKRSLVFEESPSESHLCPLSPLVCADNPVTAVSVPIDSSSNISWVSPQFNGITPSHGRRRQVRRRHNTNNQQGEKVSKENSRTRTCRSGSHRKYSALQFLGDVSKSKSTKRTGRAKRSTEHTEHESVSQVYKKKKKSKCDKQNVFNDSVGSGLGNGENYGYMETVRTILSSKKSGDHHHRPSLARCSVYCGGRTDSPTDSACDRSVSSLRRRNPKAASQVRSDTDSSQCEGGSLTSDELKGARRKSYNSNILLSPLETSDLSWSGRGTPVVKQICEVPLRVALFTHSPSGDAVNTSTTSCLTQQDSDSQNESLGHDVSCVQEANIFSRSRSRGADWRHCQSSLSAHKGGKLRRSKRLQAKYLEVLGYLQADSPCASHSSNILVSDTPESQYGLTFKQRMRLKLKTKV